MISRLGNAEGKSLSVARNESRSTFSGVRPRVLEGDGQIAFISKDRGSFIAIGTSHRQRRIVSSRAINGREIDRAIAINVFDGLSYAALIGSRKVQRTACEDDRRRWIKIISSKSSFRLFAINIGNHLVDSNFLSAAFGLSRDRDGGVSAHIGVCSRSHRRTGNAGHHCSCRSSNDRLHGLALIGGSLLARHDRAACEGAGDLECLIHC